MAGSLDFAALRSGRRAFYAGAPFIYLCTLQYRLDSFHHAVIQLFDYLAGFHVFPSLLRLRRTSEDGAHVRISQAPRAREVWQANSEIACYLRESLPFREPVPDFIT